jgi:hypothetical protein
MGPSSSCSGAGGVAGGAAPRPDSGRLPHRPLAPFPLPRLRAPRHKKELTAEYDGKTLTQMNM